MRCICLFALVFVATASRSAFALDFAWTAKLGGEYDTNVERVLGDDGSADGVLRAFGSLDLRSGIGRAGQVAAGARLGARLPVLTRAEDSATTQLSVGGRRVSQRRSLWWGGGADLRDSTLRSEVRDYTRVGGRLSLGGDPGRWRVVVHVGGSQLWFRPQPELSNAGPDVSADVGLEPIDGFDVGVFGDASVRYYGEARYVESGLMLRRDDEDRRDVVVGSGVRLRYTSGSFLASTGYRMQRGVSNSFGRSYLRHSIEGEFGVVPFGQVLVRVSGRLLLTHYDDPANIDATLLLDDDSRSSVSCTIEVPLPGDIVAIEARGERFADRGSEPAASYERWVAYLGVSFRGQRRTTSR